MKMKNKAPMILSLLAVLVFAVPAKATQELNNDVQSPGTISYSDTDFSKSVGELVVGGLTLFFLIQVSKRK